MDSSASVKDLRVQAKEAGITGYSKMNKTRLLEALSGRPPSTGASSALVRSNEAPALPEAPAGVVYVARAAKQVKFNAAGRPVAEVIARVKASIGAQDDDEVLLDGRPITNPEKTILKVGQRLTFVAPVGRNA